MKIWPRIKTGTSAVQPASGYQRPANSHVRYSKGRSARFAICIWNPLAWTAQALPSVGMKTGLEVRQATICALLLCGPGPPPPPLPPGVHEPGCRWMFAQCDRCTRPRPVPRKQSPRKRQPHRRSPFPQWLRRCYRRLRRGRQSHAPFPALPPFACADPTVLPSGPTKESGSGSNAQRRDTLCCPRRSSGRLGG